MYEGLLISANKRDYLNIISATVIRDNNQSRGKKPVSHCQNKNTGD